MGALRAWLTPPTQRIYPAQPPDDRATLRLLTPRNARAAFQVGVWSETLVDCTVSAGVPSEAGAGCRIRRADLVPLPHVATDTPRDELDGVGYVPGLVPDPLVPTGRISLAAFESRSFWLDLHVPADASVGVHELRVEVCPGNAEPVELRVVLEIAEPVLRPRTGFPVTHWFYNDAIADWYRLRPFCSAYWGLFDAYVRDVVDHGQDTLLVPAFTPPTDGVKRPTQLVGVRRGTAGGYDLDFSAVSEYVRRAQALGIRFFEWNHLVTQWGAANAIRVYEGDPEDRRLLWQPETPSTDPVYREFLSQYLAELREFLLRHCILDSSFFHISDEPGDAHLATYKATRDMVREIAPWVRTIEALSHVEFARDGLVDMPIPSIRTVHEFAAEGVESWCYFCCGPRGRYLQRLLDTPLPKIRMAGWLFYRFGMKGFLHWGYNYWYRSQTTELIDPYQVNHAHRWPNWPCGDAFVVYPGPDGPIDSLRWEVFALSLQDYAMLDTLGVGPEDERLADLRGFDDFPKQADWHADAVRGLLAAGEGA